MSKTTVTLLLVLVLAIAWRVWLGLWELLAWGLVGAIVLCVLLAFGPYVLQLTRKFITGR